ncbi:MAG TPA: hypothetical protein VFE25_09020 [Opitutaceae bacterium]|nr:hypothetical protein [Opitutaceae bacterium]
MSSPPWSFAAVAILCASLCGCASVESVDASRDTVAKAKKVTLLALREPPVVHVVNFGGAASLFGAVGGLVQGLTNAEHSKTFVAKLVSMKVTLKGPLQDSIVSALQKDGYQVSVDTTQYPVKTADGKSDDFSNVNVDSDAIMAVWITHEGYMSSATTTHYQPWVVIRVRLIDARTKKDLYFKTFMVGYEMHIDNAVKIPADPKYRFSSFDDLMARMPEAVAGLIDSGNLASAQVGADLSKQP